MSSEKQQVMPGNSRLGRMLRGLPETTDVGVSRKLGGGAGGLYLLALLEKCDVTEECAPGSFMVSFTTRTLLFVFSTDRLPFCPTVLLLYTSYVFS